MSNRRRLKAGTQFYTGFVDDKIPTWTTTIADVRAIEVFTSKKAAREHYEDVRVVEIREIRKVKS